MKKLILLSTVMAIGLGGAAVAETVKPLAAATKSAQEGVKQQQFTKTVVSGQNTMVQYYTALRAADCSSTPTATIRVLKKPGHGEISTDKLDDFAVFPEGSPLLKCTDKKVPTTQLHYKSADDFVGQDEFIVLAIFANGNAVTQEFTVDVR